MKKDFLKALLVASFLTGCQGMSFDLPQTSDQFEQTISYNNKVDILWIVDNSTSMLKHQQNLSAQIPELVSKLNSLKMDYQMAVISSSMGGSLPDGGKFLGSPKYLTAKTSNLASTLADRMVVGEAGSNNERGLESMEVVLSAPYSSGEGKGFLRDDALLVVIALSDEEDKSRPVSTAVQYYSEFLDSIKAPWVDGSRSWVFNFIGVLSLSSQCRTFNDYAEPGEIFKGLVAVSGGIQETICNNSLASALGNIRARMYEILTDFKLSNIPAIETIVVKINGQVVPRSQVNGWDYIESLNLIRFYGSAVPSADSSISVDFKPRTVNKAKATEPPARRLQRSGFSSQQRRTGDTVPS